MKRLINMCRYSKWMVGWMWYYYASQRMPIKSLKCALNSRNIKCFIHVLRTPTRGAFCHSALARLLHL